MRRKRNLDCDYPGLEFKRVETPEQLQHAFEMLIQFHQTRWTERGYPGSFASPCFGEFHRKVILSGLQAGFLQLFCLQCNLAIIGVFYCYRIGDTLQAYQYGFDECWSSYGIGNLMIWQMIEHSILNGVAVFDFLEGDEKYKEDWATSVRENVCLRVYGSGWSGRFAYVKSRLITFAMDLGFRFIPETTRHSIRKMFLRWRASRQDESLNAKNK
jgi:CelD/BcsL family acetyltransferase involved in cellulose biosynthesis